MSFNFCCSSCKVDFAAATAAAASVAICFLVVAILSFKPFCCIKRLADSFAALFSISTTFARCLTSLS